MAISPDGTTLLVGDAEGPVRVQRVADDRVLHAIPGQSPVTVVAWSPTGRRFAIGRLDGTSEVYSLNPLQQIMVTSGSDQVSALGFVGEHGLMRESSTGSIARYDLAALSPVATQVATPPIHALDAAAGLIAQGEDNGRVTIRDGRTLEQIGAKLTLGPYRSRDRGPGMALGRRITALALTRDGSAVIAADRVGHLRMWSLPGRELLWSRDDVPTSWLAVSPDGRYLATVGNTFKGGVPEGYPMTSTFTVWDLRTRTRHSNVDFTDREDQPQLEDSSTDQARPVPRTVVFSPDGNRVAIAYINGFVMIYDVTLRRRASWRIDTFETPPSSVAFSPDSQRLLAASPDSLREWDATTGKLLSRSPVPGLRDLTRMTYTNDGRWLVISHPRSLSVLDAQTLRVAVADLPLDTEAPTDAFAVTAGQEHQLLVGTRSVLASIEMDPEQWKSTACQVAAHRLTKVELTKDEWNRFLPGTPYAPACR
jgi:WD40 repeat protein